MSVEAFPFFDVVDTVFTFRFSAVFAVAFFGLVTSDQALVSQTPLFCHWSVHEKGFFLGDDLMLGAPSVIEASSL